VVAVFQEGVEEVRKDLWVYFMDFLLYSNLDLVGTWGGDVGEPFKDEGNGVGIYGDEIFVGR
jgi:hypothetical protein